MNKTILYIKTLVVVCLFTNFNKQPKTLNNPTVSTAKVLNNDIQGKILAGYQAWFNAPEDGYELGWKHYSNREGKKRSFKPGSTSVDYWPEVSELKKNIKYKTSFKHKDGSNAYVYSSADAKTVNLHFKWMKQYGIDGVFAQRFVTSLKSEKGLKNYNKTFDNCVKGAKKNDRQLSLMYDLTASSKETVVEDIKNDWKKLVRKYDLNNPNNTNVLTYKGKAVIALWGVGFSGKRRGYTLENIKELITFFKKDSKYGNCTVLLGVPTYWRTLRKDATNNPELHKVIKMADIVHPWSVARYATLEGADNHHKNNIVKDKKWCDNNGLLYMPVVFPGFSWANLKKEPNNFNQIPRLKGDFLWRQCYNAVSSNVETIYVAMFDEMDEGTCIFKVDNNPPVGKSKFLTYEGLPADYYLWLTGQAGKMLRKEIPINKQKPNYP